MNSSLLNFFKSKKIPVAPTTEIYEQALTVFNRLRSSAQLPKDIAKRSEVQFDGRTEWVEAMLDSNTVHDDDYAVFGMLPKTKAVVLDIGANYGYSVRSLRSSGVTNPILSFEVLPDYAAALEIVKRRFPVDYDFVMSGVGSEAGSLNFYTPVVGKAALTALTTARAPAFTEHEAHWSAKAVESHVLSYPTPLFEDFRFAILKTVAKVDRIDNLLKNYSGAIDVSRVAAMKIDVEGLEYDVLLGAAETIKKCMPLLMLESGNRPPRVKRLLDSWGYATVDFVNNKLKIIDGISTQVNGFFIHPKGVIPKGFKF
ncbi:MAG: FkbM family methyltransferase [Pseudomonadota bacterium]|nr:FkbM family methyltransferase [Pseudomonadota bacterium]